VIAEDNEEDMCELEREIDAILRPVKINNVMNDTSANILMHSTEATLGK